MNDFLFMGTLLQLGSYLQAHLWRSSLVFQQSWEEAMNSSLCWAKDNVSNGEIRYSALSHKQSSCSRNSFNSPDPCTVSDVKREDHCGTGAEHDSNWGMGETGCRTGRVTWDQVSWGQGAQLNMLQTPSHLSRSLLDLRVHLKKAEQASESEWSPYSHSCRVKQVTFLLVDGWRTVASPWKLCTGEELCSHSYCEQLQEWRAVFLKNVDWTT